MWETCLFKCFCCQLLYVWLSCFPLTRMLIQQSKILTNALLTQRYCNLITDNALLSEIVSGTLWRKFSRNRPQILSLKMWGFILNSHRSNNSLESGRSWATYMYTVYGNDIQIFMIVNNRIWHNIFSLCLILYVIIVQIRFFFTIKVNYVFLDKTFPNKQSQ